MLLASINSHLFVAPDNGVLSGVYQDPEDINVHQIEAEHYFLRPLSSTFHGRDILAPVAGWLTKGVEVESFGDKIDDYVDLKLPVPEVNEDEGMVEGQIIHIDSFGNLVTNITRARFDEMLEASENHQFELAVGDHVIKELKHFYAECDKQSPALLFGSTSQLEVSVNEASAKEVLGFDKGQKLTLRFL